MKTIVLGLGNPLMGDDSAGYRAAAVLRNRVRQAEITIQEFCGAGIDVIFLVSGYDKAIIVDAIHTQGNNTGSIYRTGITELMRNDSIFPHQTSFVEAFELGRRTGIAVPEDISLYLMEAGNTDQVGTDCSPAITIAIDNCVKMIIKELMAIGDKDSQGFLSG
jgi:hydrogenase maturation protease